MNINSNLETNILKENIVNSFASIFLPDDILQNMQFNRILQTENHVDQGPFFKRFKVCTVKLYNSLF
jgi:hypothetical protein